VNNEMHAFRWNATAATAENINPVDSSSSTAFACANDRIVGYSDSPFNGYATLWQPLSVDYLSPRINQFSVAIAYLYGADDNEQVGLTYVAGRPHATRWRGSVESWVDLHPDEASHSWAFGAHGGQQVGYSLVENSFRASLWHGTSESWIDLGVGQARGVHRGQQVGFSSGLGDSRAALWRGTADSLVDLHPLGASRSRANAVHAGIQAGTVLDAMGDRASLWTGTAESWLDLHALLPPAFSVSEAHAIGATSDLLFVAGFGYNTLTSRYEALLWTHPLPLCDSIDFNNSGSQFEGQDIEAFLSVFSEGPCVPAQAACNDIDFNNDGSLFDPCDIDAFLLVFSEGPCTPCGQ
jgi:hypothetical protein